MVQTHQKEHLEGRKCWKQGRQRERGNEELESQSTLNGDLGWGKVKCAPTPSTSAPSDLRARGVVERKPWTSSSRYLGSGLTATHPLCDQGKPLSLSEFSFIHLKDRQ